MSALTDFFTPPLCPLCLENLFQQEGEFCPACEEAMPRLPERVCPGCGGPNDTHLNLCKACSEVPGGRPWALAVSAFPFYAQARTAIHRYKYRGDLPLAPVFAQKMADAWSRRSPQEKPDLITYIPLFLLRYLKRGYNQAEILAKMVGERLGIPACTTLLRIRKTCQQASLSFQERLKNMKNAFHPWRPSRFQNAHVLLVDDVFTTGSTLTSAAEALLQSGAKKISVLTIARD